MYQDRTIHLYFQRNPDTYGDDWSIKQVCGSDYNLLATMRYDLRMLQYSCIAAKIIQNKYVLVEKNRYGEEDGRLFRIMQYHLPTLARIAPDRATGDPKQVFTIEKQDVALLMLMAP